MGQEAPPNGRCFVAGREHNDQLCMLMRSIPVPGNIEMLYTREPDYFHGLDIQGKYHDIGAYEVDGKVVSFGCRSIKPMYVNGRPMDFGYLHDLRALPGFRGGKTGEIFSLLKGLHEDRRTPAYVSIIIKGNEPASQALASKRPGMPDFNDFGKYSTFAVNLNRYHVKRKARSGTGIVTGEKIGIDAITAFLNREGSRKQFFPVYTREDFSSDYTRDFRLEDFYVAMRGREIVGVIGKWDQARLKQNVVINYHGYLHYIRPVFNTVMRVIGYEPLPRLGEKIKMFYASFICIKDDDPAILRDLIEQLYQDNRRKSYHYVAIGFHEDDRLIEAMEGYTSIRYYSRLYIVTWGDHGQDYFQTLDRSRVPYLELAAL